MRKNIVAGNWKMNTTVQEGVALAKGVNEALKNVTPNCDVIIGVPFTHLTSINDVIDSSKLGLAAENCADHKSGAYTGEVSSHQLKSLNIPYCIVGHSERREHFFEDVEAKLKAAEKYVFISFFIIADGSIWERYTEILEEKIQKGVKIYIMFDDTGSFMQMSDTSIKELKDKGFKVLIFNPVERSYHRLFFNYRNHQKITIIDGNIGYIKIGSFDANVDKDFLPCRQYIPILILLYPHISMQFTYLSSI